MELASESPIRFGGSMSIELTCASPLLARFGREKFSAFDSVRGPGGRASPLGELGDVASP
jgi:hypothetical protein